MDKQIYCDLLSLIPVLGLGLVIVTSILLIAKLRAVKGQMLMVFFIIGVVLCELRPQELKNVTSFSEMPDNRYQIAGQVPKVNYVIITYIGVGGDIDAIMVKDVPSNLKLGTIFAIENGQVKIEWQPGSQRKEKKELEKMKLVRYDFLVKRPPRKPLFCVKKGPLYRDLDHFLFWGVSPEIFSGFVAGRSKSHRSDKVVMGVTRMRARFVPFVQAAGRRYTAPETRLSPEGYNNPFCPYVNDVWVTKLLPGFVNPDIQQVSPPF